MTTHTYKLDKLRIAATWAAVVLALMLSIVAMSTVSADAGTTYTEGALYYTIADDSITITGYFGKDPVVTVPSVIAGTPVNTIAAGAFADTEATTVNLPDTITTIEQGAFTAGTVIVTNYNTESPVEEEAAETTDSGGTGADYADTEPGDTIEIGDKEMTVVTNDNGRITLVDAEGRTYHSNGSLIIDDETHKPLEGDVRIKHQDGTEEVYTTLDDEEDTQKVDPAVIIVAVVLLIALIFIAFKSRKKKKNK